jgi:adenosine deaminase
VHPVGEFLKAGVCVTLSSDDPSFFGASLLDEFERAAQHGLGRPQIIQLARNSFQSSFASGKEKRVWLEELDAYLATPQARD